MATETAVKISNDMPPEHASTVTNFFKDVGINSSLSPQFHAKDAYANILRDILQADRMERGKITCSFTVQPVIALGPMTELRNTLGIEQSAEEVKRGHIIPSKST